MTVGEATVVAQVVQESPVDGVQEYPVPPDATSVVSLPRQIDVPALTVRLCAEVRLNPTSRSITARILRIRFRVFIFVLFYCVVEIIY